jgi:hypothetical protein
VIRRVREPTIIRREVDTSLRRLGVERLDDLDEIAEAITRSGTGTGPTRPRA